MARGIAIAAAITVVATVTAFSRPARHVAASIGDRTTLDSVYTAGQAQRGDSLFKATCDRCHGDAAAGKDVDGGRLKGANFLATWSGVTLDQLYTSVYTTMPSDNPKSLPSKDVADLLAYLLARNEFPAGSVALPDSIDRLKEIKIATSR